MGIGIRICGLNGCGKSTLGKALAEKIGFHFIDNEYLYFPRNRSDEAYTFARSQEEVERLLLEEVRQHPNFVFAAVKGDYGKEMIPRYHYVVMIETPKNIRSQRVRDRSFQKFGSRMLEGGDLYQQEENFFRMVADRPDDYIEDWLQTVKCPIIRVDGRKTVAENIAYIIKCIGI